MTEARTLDLAPGRHSLKGADAANVASVTMLKVLATHLGIRALPARLAADAEGHFCTPSHPATLCVNALRIHSLSAAGSFDRRASQVCHAT